MNGIKIIQTYAYMDIWLKKNTALHNTVDERTML